MPSSAPGDRSPTEDWNVWNMSTHVPLGDKRRSMIDSDTERRETIAGPTNQSLRLWVGRHEHLVRRQRDRMGWSSGVT